MSSRALETREPASERHARARDDTARRRSSLRTRSRRAGHTNWRGERRRWPQRLNVGSDDDDDAGRMGRRAPRGRLSVSRGGVCARSREALVSEDPFDRLAARRRPAPPPRRVRNDDDAGPRRRETRTRAARERLRAVKEGSLVKSEEDAPHAVPFATLPWCSDGAGPVTWVWSGRLRGV